MAIKTRNQKVDINSRWLKKREENLGRNQEKEKDTKYNQRQQYAERVKSAGIKLKNIYKAKLGDDLRVFEYAVIKIDRLSGEVSLKNERNTIRKVNILDGLFGARKDKKQKWV